jgi:hypothetical protein
MAFDEPRNERGSRQVDGDRVMPFELRDRPHGRDNGFAYGTPCVLKETLRCEGRLHERHDSREENVQPGPFGERDVAAADPGN